MDKVHTRSFDKRIVIEMNDDFQPIAENDKVLSELSSFLGTLAKRCVPLTYVTWRHVPKNLRQTMWNYVKVSMNKYHCFIIFSYLYWRTKSNFN